MAQIIAIAIAVAALASVIVYRRWQSHVEEQAEQERERFERILRASDPPAGPWPHKGPKGFDRSRNRMVS